jgi:hypothetical protein
LGILSFIFSRVLKKFKKIDKYHIKKVVIKKLILVLVCIFFSVLLLGLSWPKAITTDFPSHYDMVLVRINGETDDRASVD